MYKKLVIISLSFLAITIGVFGYIIADTDASKEANSVETETGDSTNNEQDDKIDSEKAGAKENASETKKVDPTIENPFGDHTPIDELTADDYQNYMHGMSHQKVKANEKWTFYQMTTNRIEWLLQGLDESSIRNEEIYREILERWLDGDFSRADQDHNDIWRLQGGTIGKATGLLSEEEEQAYLESKLN